MTDFIQNWYGILQWEAVCVCVFFFPNVSRKGTWPPIIYMKKFTTFLDFWMFPQLHFSICFDFNFDMDLEKKDD